jgi:hypothetical protein
MVIVGHAAFRRRAKAAYELTAAIRTLLDIAADCVQLPGSDVARRAGIIVRLVLVMFVPQEIVNIPFAHLLSLQMRISDRCRTMLLTKSTEPKPPGSRAGRQKVLYAVLII